KGSARTQEQVTDSKAIPGSSSKPSPAFTFVGDLVEEVAEKLHSRELLVFDRSGALSAATTARLLLLAATNYDWNSQHIEFGAHEINSMYLHREAAPLTGLERVFLLRTILLDTFSIKPGWYWIHKWKVKTAIWLPYLAVSDSDESMRVAAVQLAIRSTF